MMAEHTPIPWEAYNGHDGKLGCWVILNGNTQVTRTSYDAPVDQANAALIVRAVNSHAELLAVLEDIVARRPKSMLEDCAYQGPPPKSWVKEMASRYEGYNEALKVVQDISRDAIARASGQSEGSE